MDYKKIAEEAINLLQKIHGRMICIGGPFNDNSNCFTEKQLEYLRPVWKDSEDFIEEHWCYHCNEIR